MYHIDGNLTIANQSAVKDLVVMLTPLLKALRGSRKLILTTLAHYWVTPCCIYTRHLTNYRAPGYLPRFVEAVSALRDHIRDSLYMRRVPNFQVLCPNRMFDMGHRRQD
jgi:hypothetical protein